MKEGVLNQRGSTFVSVLFTMLIAVGLYFLYFEVHKIKSDKATGQHAIQQSQGAACRANRQLIEREIRMWQANRPNEQPTFDDLRRERLRVPSCPEDGQYDIDGRHVTCSKHD